MPHEAYSEKREVIAGEEDEGKRIDLFLSEALGDDISRTFLQKLIVTKSVLGNGKPIKKSSFSVQEGVVYSIFLPKERKLETVIPENIPLDILYEDTDALVINKPAGMVVHPDKTYSKGTVVNAVLSHCDNSLSGIGGVIRPGIVHRLDKDTSGVLLIAKNDKAHRHFAEEIAMRRVQKIYTTLVFGRVKALSGSVDSPIIRDPSNRQKMSVSDLPNAKHALTHFTVENFFRSPLCTLLRVQIVTGRTHQIRVHFSSLNFPVVGDETYGNEKQNREFFKAFPLSRIFLHAQSFEIVFPSGEKKHFEARLSEDLEKCLRMLKEE
jgi:23S rRNA pseudouridine1911/1915/1917 synthase